MKRVTLLAHDVGDPNESTGKRPIVLTNVDGRHLYLTLPSDIFEVVEDIPEPLPTEPGERFWGRSTHFGPQWWFVAGSNSCRPDPDEVDYVGADGTHISSLLAVESHGLTRLPDPEPQP